jgi:phenol/toluene 2-monooxygenase (NADH) P1/A1
VTVQIKTIDIEPKRQTFGHVARRLGGDKPASRYQEATLDVQATANFHYKPLWEGEYWQYDTRKTAVVMEDWYKPLDPRQYYYATYNIARANMN